MSTNLGRNLKFMQELERYFVSTREILLNYAVFNRSLGYTQGMSDLLSPLLAVLQDEVKVFWCFSMLMDRNEFLKSPKLSLIKDTVS
eukprot:m.56064 g.56064  ORF g.56064 m.56064 type:complete len:87 (+) comp34543_c0_seq2:1021-1281(+)